MIELDPDTITNAIRYVNLILIPVGIWIVRIERRIMRIETILELKKKEGETNDVHESDNNVTAIDSKIGHA